MAPPRAGGSKNSGQELGLNGVYDDKRVCLSTLCRPDRRAGLSKSTVEQSQHRVCAGSIKKRMALPDAIRLLCPSRSEGR